MNLHVVTEWCDAEEECIDQHRKYTQIYFKCINGRWVTIAIYPAYFI